ncbi:MAG: carbamoyl-phosphate synthase subunit L, partial [Hyphomicrobiales bacterium]|nr:carbamoyl-phosphate synthase subunit L [Hyphomicrobiales bacterium]
RLQVEHPVTEAITGLDLVELQLRIAAGEPLGFTQQDVRMDGHAIEARVYAEDADNAFLPSTGTIAHLRLPGGDGIRVDAGVEEGAEISAWYDPMIAKIIAHGATREDTRARLLLQALEQTQIAGPKTNIPFLRNAISDTPFARGAYTTATIENAGASAGGGKLGVDTALVRIAALALMEQERAQDDPAEQQCGPSDHDAPPDGEWRSPWDERRGFQLSGLRHQSKSFTIGGVLHQATMTWLPWGVIEAKAGGNISTQQHVKAARDEGVLIDTPQGLYLREGADYYAVRPISHDAAGGGRADDSAAIVSPMHGRVTAIMVQRGETVQRGAAVAIVEAMKMEHVLTAPRDGTIEEICAAEGQQVTQGAPIIRLED